MTDSEYLQATNIVRLQAAARMAGLRWKNGEPGTDKAGIIARLQNHPSIMRATIATLERMAKGEHPQTAPSKTTLQQEMEAELEESGKLPDAPIIPGQAIDLSEYAKRVELHNAVGAMAAESLKTRIHVTDQLEGFAKQIEALETRRPIEFHFPERKPILIEPGNHHESYPKLIKYLEINRRCLLTGSAGTGKSVAVKNAAEALGADFYYQPPVAMAHELIGHLDAQGVFHDTPTTLAFKNGGLVLWDEMDASMADALLPGNAIADGNGWATLGDGKLHQMHPGFYIVGNMNTDGFGATMQYPGRTRLDGATIARFSVRIHWGIDARIENLMAQGQTEFYRAIVAVRDFMVAADIQDVNATPRHLKTGAALLNAGCPRNEVFADCIKNGAITARWSDVQKLPAVATFLRG